MKINKYHDVYSNIDCVLHSLLASGFCNEDISQSSCNQEKTFIILVWDLASPVQSDGECLMMHLFWSGVG